MRVDHDDRRRLLRRVAFVPPRTALVLPAAQAHDEATGAC
jgi:hypothetical protein